MIAYIKGSVEHSGEDHVILDNNGIGYLISMPLNEIEKVKKMSGTIKIYTYHYVREDAMGLYGFLDSESLSMFKLLLNVSGVGPKAALSMLSTLSPQSLILSIITGDDKSLSKAPGIGKKLAQRIILELKDKFKDYSFTEKDDGDRGVNDDSMEAMAALMALGYTRLEATTAIKKAGDGNNSVEETVKKALKLLMKG